MLQSACILRYAQDRLLQRPLLRPGAGAVHQRGYGGAGAGEPAGAEPVRVR
jgi:hypothetical protein